MIKNAISLVRMVEWCVGGRVGKIFATSHEVVLSPSWTLRVHIKWSSKNLGWSQILCELAHLFFILQGFSVRII